MNLRKARFYRSAIYPTLLASSILIASLTCFQESQAIERAVDQDPDTLDGPPRQGTWATAPPVVVCENAMATKAEVQEAIAYWKRHGYSFGRLLFHKNPAGVCSDETPFGYIVIREATSSVRSEMEEGTLAETHFYVDPKNWRIQFATVFLVYPPIRRVLEHEFGHALSFYHYNKRGHLMHVRNSYGGWGDHGLGLHHKKRAFHSQK